MSPDTHVDTQAAPTRASLLGVIRQQRKTMVVGLVLMVACLLGARPARRVADRDADRGRRRCSR